MNKSTTKKKKFLKEKYSQQPFLQIQTQKEK
jgi:hypothetical protein